jgi:GNAT superfamily N-acetyltransferase
MIRLDLSASVDDLEQIIALQKLNRTPVVAEQDWATQGFVTMEYTVQQLLEMAGGYQHIVARAGVQVIGYALVMQKECRAAFPALEDMFAHADACVVNGKPMRDTPYFVMGQVCVAQAFRGQGVFRRLYQALSGRMRADFALVVTEVSVRNVRSMRAHEKIGFRNIRPADDPAAQWRTMVWDWIEAPQVMQGDLDP